MKRRDELLVGLLTAVAVVVLAIGLIWLSRGGLSKGYPLYAKFPWGQNLKQGQQVLLAGINIGYVDDAQLLEREASVVVTMQINNDHHVPKGSTAAVVASGLFGDVAIALTPPAPSPISYQPGDTVPTGKSAPGLADLTARFDTISTTFKALTDELRAQMVAGGGIADIRKTMAQANRFAAQLSTIAATQSRELSLTMASFRQTAAHVSSAVDTAEIEATLRNLRTTTAHATAISDSLTQTAGRLNALLAQAQSGNGTIGKFLTDTGLYSDARRLLTRVDSLTLDFKEHPKKYINLRIF